MQLITAALWLNKGYNSIEYLGGEYWHMPTHLDFGRLLCQIQHTQFSKSNIFVGGDFYNFPGSSPQAETSLCPQASRGEWV